MSLYQGLLAAMISALGWGSYLVPMKRVKNYDPYLFQFLMGLSIFLSSCIYAVISNNIVFSYYGIISGMLWSLGNILSIMAVKYSGLSRAAPLWMSIGSASSFLIGILFLGESINKITLAVLGIILLIIGVTVIAKINPEKSKGIKGLVIAILAGITFGIYLVPLKLSKLPSQEFLFSMTLGIAVTCTIIWMLSQRKMQKEIIIPGLISGAIWNIANFSSFYAVLNLGLSIGFPLTQTALFVSVMWGVLYFKEIKKKSQILKVIIGSIALFIGAFMLIFSL